MPRAIVQSGLFLSVLLLALGSEAKPKKDKPIKSSAGGASKTWACKQLSDAACDLSKRCEPDRASRHCRKLRERCDDVKDGNAGHATDDDVTSCRDALGDLSCRQLTFDNQNGVDIDFKHIDLCSGVATDNLLPRSKDAAPPSADDKPKDDKPKDDKAAKSSGDDDEAPKGKHDSDD
jgi:hypothetical protein